MIETQIPVLSLSLSNGIIQPVFVGSERGAKIKPHWGWNSSLPSETIPF